MKEKIIIFAIGLLSGAIIATGAIFAYTFANNNSNSTLDASRMGGDQMPTGQAPADQGGEKDDGTTPPEKPSEANQTKAN